MNKSILTRSVFAVLLLGSTLAVAESEYPATNYQPHVIFHDGNANESAKKSQPAPKAAQPLAPIASTSSAAKASTGATVTTAPAEKAESDNSLLLLGLLAVGGVFFFKSKCATKKQDDTRSVRSNPTGLTGVARYLKKLDASAGTGVARYLDKIDAEAQAKAAAEAEARAIAAESTGVAKYIKQASNAPKSSAGGEATGVARYLRDRG